MICTACAGACALSSVSVLGENALERLGHIVPFASSEGSRSNKEHWHSTHIQEAEDAFDAFATPERDEACNARFSFLVVSRTPSNASHAQASYNSNTQLGNAFVSKQRSQPGEEHHEIEFAEPQRALGHTMSDAKFANLEAQVAMLTDLLRNLAPTANAAEGPLCILAVIMIVVCVRGCFRRDVPKIVGGMSDTGARHDNVLRGPFGGVAAGNAGGTNGGSAEALRRAESMRSPPNFAGDGATHVHAPFNNNPTIYVPQNPDLTGEGLMQVMHRVVAARLVQTTPPLFNNDCAPCPRPFTSKIIPANTTGNAQIQAPVVPPLSDATSEPDNTSSPSSSPSETLEKMHSERPLKKRERESGMIKTESDGDVAAFPGDVRNMAGVDGGTKDDSILISDSDSDDEDEPNPRKVQRVD
jgi:hypothetical protein